MRAIILAAGSAALELVGTGWVVGRLEAQELPELTVVANRVETPLGNVGSTFSSLEVELLERRGIVTLEDALRHVPGTGIGSEGGQRGSISALRIRGSEADQTLLLIDGMRVTDANVTPFNLLGGETLLGYSQVNVLRGPQSSLYGSEAIGGVVTLDTRVGSGEGRQRVFGEVGSFGSLRGGAELQGEWSGIRWYAGGSHETTTNDRSFNDFEQNQLALRVETDLSVDTVVGLTARSWMSDFQNPGSTAPFSSRAVDERSAYLLTAYVDHVFSDQLRSKVVAGYYREEFEERGLFPFESEAEKVSFDLRNVVKWGERHETVVGGLVEQSAFRSTGTPVDEDGWLTGLYLNHLWQPLESLANPGLGELTLSVGGRWEHIERWDDVFTWRTTGSWRPPGGGVRLHGSYGTGFRAPSYFELYGAIPAFNFLGNPDLKAERSKGWDLGVEWEAGSDLVLDVTWFHNRINDLIDFTPVNVGRATTRGVEVSAAGSLLGDWLNWRGSYTWLDANDDSTGLRLVRRARHRASIDLQAEPCEGLVLGVGGTYADGIVDNDFSVFPAPRKQLDEVALVRAYGRLDLNESISVHARIENLLDLDYEEVANYPARGLGVFGGLEVRW